MTKELNVSNMAKVFINKAAFLLLYLLAIGCDKK